MYAPCSAAVERNPCGQRMVRGGAGRRESRSGLVIQVWIRSVGRVGMSPWRPLPEQRALMVGLEVLLRLIVGGVGDCSALIALVLSCRPRVTLSSRSWRGSALCARSAITQSRHVSVNSVRPRIVRSRLTHRFQPTPPGKPQVSASMGSE